MINWIPEELREGLAEELTTALAKDLQENIILPELIKTWTEGMVAGLESAIRISKVCQDTFREKSTPDIQHLCYAATRGIDTVIEGLKEAIKTAKEMTE